MNFYTKQCIIYCTIFIIFSTAKGQEIYSNWDNPTGYYSTSRTPETLCTILGCPTLTNPQHVADKDMGNTAMMSFPALSILSSASITMSLTQTATGTTGGVRVASSSNFLTLSVLPTLEVALLNNNTVVATKTFNSLVDLSVFSAGNIARLNVTPATGGISYNKVRFKVTVPVGVNARLSFSVYNGYANSIQNVLPITLNFFKAVADNDCNVALSWSTTSEQNTRTFEIQRQTEHSNSWHTVASIPANGNSQRRLEYSYKDVSPGNDNLYYRLLVKDYDGSAELFEAGKVIMRCVSKTTVVFPTVVNGNHVTIRSADVSSSDYQVRLFNISGKQHAINIEKNRREIRVSFSPLPPGVYVLHFGTSATNDTRRLLVP